MEQKLAQVLLNAKLGKLDLVEMGQAGSRKVKRSYTVERVSALAREHIRTAASAPATDWDNLITNEVSHQGSV